MDYHGFPIGIQMTNKNKLKGKDIAIGYELPTLVKAEISLQDLVEWCGVEGDYLNIHYDKVAAEKAGLPDCLVQGTYKLCLLGRMVTDWLGDGGNLNSIAIKYIGMDFPGSTLECKGMVSSKVKRRGSYLLGLDVWVENAKGDKTAVGTAAVSIKL